MNDSLTAVIDLGSNSVRLMIFKEGIPGTQIEIENLKQSIRLSNHITEDHKISEEGIIKTLHCLKEFIQLCKAHHVREVLGVATAVVRSAINGEQFIRRIFQDTGILFRILTGSEEAYYGYLAVVNTLPIEEGITIDIGGGSTELTYFKDRQLVERTSISFGLISLSKLLNSEDPPSYKTRKHVEEIIEKELDSFLWLKNRRCPVIGISGTSRNIAKIHKKLRNYPLSILHAYYMWPYEVMGIYDWLASIPLEKRKEIEGLSKDRADIIIAGIAVINQILLTSKANQFILCDKGLREGLLIEKGSEQLGERYLLTDILQNNIDNYLDHFQINRVHAEHVTKLSLQLFSQMKAKGWHAYNEQVLKWLKAASMLYKLGQSISIQDLNQHTFYLLTNLRINGLTHREQMIIAMIASYKNEKSLHRLLVKYEDIISTEDLSIIEHMGILLQIARALDWMENSCIHNIHFVEQENGANLLCECNQFPTIEIQMAIDWVMKLGKLYGRELNIEIIQKNSPTGGNNDDL